MADILIDNLDDDLYERLARSAASRGRPIGVEARELLRIALARQACAPRENIVDAAQRLFGPENGVDLDIPARGNKRGRPPLDFPDDY